MFSTRSSSTLVFLEVCQQLDTRHCSGAAFASIFAFVAFALALALALVASPASFGARPRGVTPRRSCCLLDTVGRSVLGAARPLLFILRAGLSIGILFPVQFIILLKNEDISAIKNGTCWWLFDLYYVTSGHSPTHVTISELSQLTQTVRCGPLNSCTVLFAFFPPLPLPLPSPFSEPFPLAWSVKSCSVVSIPGWSNFSALFDSCGIWMDLIHFGNNCLKQAHLSGQNHPLFRSWIRTLPRPLPFSFNFPLPFASLPFRVSS